MTDMEEILANARAEFEAMGLDVFLLIDLSSPLPSPALSPAYMTPYWPTITTLELMELRGSDQNPAITSALYPTHESLCVTPRWMTAQGLTVSPRSLKCDSVSTNDNTNIVTSNH